MKKGLASLFKQAKTNPAILGEVVRDPAKIAREFNLSAKEAQALKSNDFSAIDNTLNSRSLRAASHDDAYLS